MTSNKENLKKNIEDSADRYSVAAGRIPKTDLQLALLNEEVFRTPEEKAELSRYYNEDQRIRSERDLEKNRSDAQIEQFPRHPLKSTIDPNSSALNRAFFDQTEGHIHTTHGKDGKSIVQSGWTQKGKAIISTSIREQKSEKITQGLGAKLRSIFGGDKGKIDDGEVTKTYVRETTQLQTSKSEHDQEIAYHNATSGYDDVIEY